MSSEQSRWIEGQGMGWEGGEFAPPQCWICSHRNRDPRSPGPYCDAFPGGIPDEFMLNQVDHRENVPDDGGIRFALVDHEGNRAAYLRLDAYFHNVSRPDEDREPEGGVSLGGLAFLDRP